MRCPTWWGELGNIGRTGSPRRVVCRRPLPAAKPDRAPRPRAANGSRQRGATATLWHNALRGFGRTLMQQVGARALACAIALVAALLGSATAARAEDQLKVAIGQINNWENQMPTLGQDAGIFKKHGLVLDNFGTAGAGETIQPIIS